MPQLDFRQALSTPEQTLPSPDSLIATAAEIFPVKNRERFSNDAIGFSRSTWTNVVFVAIVSAGALFCAFYFFNGAQVLRAAAAWPGEFLYPRPVSGDVGAEEPNAVDHFNRTASGSRKSKDEPFDRNYFPSYLTQPGGNMGTFSPGAFGLSNPSALPFSSVSAPITQLNFLPPGADSIFQSFYQRALALVPKPVNGIVSNTVRSVRRKVSTAQQRVAGDVNKLTHPTTSAVGATNVNSVARSTAQSSQQMTNSMSANVNSSLNSVRAQSQMMMNLSHGTGLGNGLGTGVGSALGGISSGVRGVGGGRR